jgi:hypothetical protein
VPLFLTAPSSIPGVLAAAYRDRTAMLPVAASFS